MLNLTQKRNESEIVWRKHLLTMGWTEIPKISNIVRWWVSEGNKPSPTMLGEVQNGRAPPRRTFWQYLSRLQMPWSFGQAISWLWSYHTDMPNTLRKWSLFIIVTDWKSNLGIHGWRHDQIYHSNPLNEVMYRHKKMKKLSMYWCGKVSREGHISKWEKKQNGIVRSGIELCPFEIHMLMS